MVQNGDSSHTQSGSLNDIRDSRLTCAMPSIFHPVPSSINQLAFVVLSKRRSIVFGAFAQWQST